MKRAPVVLLVALLLFGMLAGCSGGGEPTSTAEEESPGASGGAAPETEEAGPVALQIETDAESKALGQAGSEDGRKWALGNPEAGAAQGEPYLVGYGFVINDGTTQYQVSVHNGEVTGYFGKDSIRVISGPFDNFNPGVTPETDRQRAAMDAALAEVALENPNAKTAVLGTYLFLFPRLEDGSSPQVAVYADPQFDYSPWSSGGPGTW
jgi:hypothetical protein